MTFYRPEIYKINCLSLFEHSFVQLLDILLQFQDDKLQQLSHICTKEASCLTMWKECLT